MKIKAKKIITDNKNNDVLLYLQKHLKNIIGSEFLDPNPPHTYNLKDILSSDSTFSTKVTKLKKIMTTCHTEKKQIIIFGDYDADGITATAIMWETLTCLGFNVLPFIPDRQEYGYGLSVQSIDYLIKKHNPHLIITVDNGVMAHDVVDYMKKKHITVILSDHHHIDKKKGLPNADIVFHTAHLSGSGIAYFLAKEIASFYTENTSLTRHFEIEFPILATIGTIADIAPMTGYGRCIVKRGLSVFPYTQRKAFQKILEKFPLKKTFSTTDIGFSIAPLLNVFGRIGDPMDALRLLCSHNSKKVDDFLLKANNLTKKRQEMIITALLNTKGQTENSHSVVYVSEAYHEGIIGLIAAGLVKKHNKPCCVITKSGEYWKGSMRSTGADMAIFLNTCDDILESGGGHVMAGGFSLKQENISVFITRFNEYNKKEHIKAGEHDGFCADIAIPLSYGSMDVAEFLETCAPFGAGNPEIIFLSTVRIFSSNPVGANKTHAKVIMQDENGIHYNGIYFSEHIKTLSLINKEVECLYTISLNYWGGMSRVERIIKALFVV